MFHILTQQLSEIGARLWTLRLALSAELSPIITEYYRKLSGGVDEITCNYKSSILSELDDAAAADATPSEAALQETYLRKLQSLEAVEKINGLTMAGPHKDDLALKISGYEMRSVGSQGQCRSAAVAMRFAAVDVASRYLSKPTLLLDDIFAELDTNRRDAVASLIRDKGCQVIIATPQVEDLPFTADAVIRL